MLTNTMLTNKLFGGTLNTTARAMDMRMERQGLIQSNVANMETPGYKVQDFSFAKVMESVASGQGELQRTHPKHMALDPLEVSKAGAFSAEERPVDLDEEMMKLSENQLMYQVAAKIVTKKFESLAFAIEEGGK
ncbi:MAG: flagellar basal body rod protein FlgB [Desulfobulbaceae bacterium]|nr:flagellar basal body rod protein FlgB [Desulfobulbaceae bacterium]